MLIRSLLIKAAMLAVTAGLVLWIGWPLPTQEKRVPASLDSRETGEAATVRADGTAGHTRATRTHRSLSTRSSGLSAGGAKLDLNRASVEELTHLPGIGQVLAKRIISHRKNNGLYQSVEDLLEVKGIGKKRMKRLRSLILVSTKPRSPQAMTGQPPQSPPLDRHTS